MREYRDYFLLMNESFVLETINVSLNVQHIPTHFLQISFSYSPKEKLPHFRSSACARMCARLHTHSPTQFLYMIVFLESVVDSRDKH